MVYSPAALIHDGAVEPVTPGSPEHVALVTRTLGIDAARWQGVHDEFARRVVPGASVAERLAVLRAAWETHGVPGSSGPPLESSPCPCCGGVVGPWIARSAPPLAAGRCAGCGHGVLLEGRASAAVYETAAYYEAVDAGTGAGYAGYEDERVYREAKGARLLDRIEAVIRPGAPRTMLEVGSGYGFTRRAAEARGIATAGVDVNPHAARAARRLHGLSTHVGDLGSALASGVVGPGAFDLVVAQFVLEHLEDPGAELDRMALALAPGGHAALIVPSAEAVEADVMGGAYRSLRGDHLHYFSRRSLGSLVERAGLETAALWTECNVHVLLGFLSAEELARDVYGAGLGPDITLVARKPA